LAKNLKEYVEIEVTDKDGKLIESRVEEGHTWTRNLIALMCVQAAQGERSGGRRIDGSYVNTRPGGATFALNGGAGNDGKGIVIGRSDTAYTLNDYDLGTRITHGTSSGQMVYNDTTVEDFQTSGGGCLFRVVRTFTNNSGASITVKEIGLICGGYYAPGYETTFLLARDVLSSPVTVPNGSTLTVRYIISFTP